MKFVGIEKDSNTLEIAKKRIHNALNGIEDVDEETHEDNSVCLL